MSLMQFVNDPENQELMKNMLTSVQNTKRITHLGREYVPQNGQVSVDTYLPVKATATLKGNVVNVVLNVANLVGQDGEQPVIRGQVKIGSNGEAIAYFFHDEGAFSARVNLAKALVAKGIVGPKDLADVLTQAERARL